MPVHDTPTTLAVVPIGGLGRAIVNSAVYQAKRGFAEPDLVVLGVDLIDKDPFAVAPDGTDVTANTDSSLVVLSAAHVRAVLQDIDRGRGLPEDFEWWIGKRQVKRLLTRVPAEAEGSAQEPVITAIAVQTDQRMLGARLDLLVKRAREAADGRTPSFLVVAGLGAGGVGPGALLATARMLRQRVGDDASMSCLVALPDAWMTLGAHAAPDVQRHMLAKTASTMRALRDLSDLNWDVRWVLGAGASAIAAKQPMAGVAAMGGTLVLQMAMAPQQFASLRPNWRQLVTPDRPFATLGASVLTLAPADQAARLAHRHAAAGWARTLDLPGPAAKTAAQRGDMLLDQYPHSPEIRTIAEHEAGVVVSLAHPESQDQLLRTGGTDQRQPPALPEALDRARLGLLAQAEDVRRLCDEILGEDRDRVAAHLALNVVQARTAMQAHVGGLVAEELPRSGANLGDDPTRLVALVATLRAAERVCRTASARLLDDAEAVNAQLEPVRLAQDALQAELDSMNNRATPPRVKRCLAATRDLVLARRWQAATASAAGLYRALADVIGEYRSRLDGSVEVLRISMRREEQLHAEAVDRLHVLGGHAHVTLAFEPDSDAQAGFDRAAEAAICGADADLAGRGLSQLSLSADGDLTQPDGWKVVLRYPGKRGAAATLRMDRTGPVTVPLDTLSTVLAHGTAEWIGTDGTIAATSLADALGFAAAAEAERAGTALALDGVRRFVDRVTDDMQHTIEPSAALRPTATGEELPSGITMVLRDGRPPQTDAGELVSTALAEHKSLRTEDPNAKSDSADGGLVVLRHYIGLSLEHFELMDRAIPAYVDTDDPVDTTPAGGLAHVIEQESWRRLDFSERRLLSSSVVPLLKDPKLLMAAGTLVAFQLLQVVEGRGPRENRQLAVVDSHNRVQARLADATNPLACIVALCTQASHLRDSIVRLGEETHWKIRENHHGDPTLAAAEFRRRIAALRLEDCHDDVDGGDLRLALETLLCSDEGGDEPITIASNPVGGSPGTLGTEGDPTPEDPS